MTQVDGGMLETQNRRKRLQYITNQITELPTLPTMIARMVELVDNPKSSAASLSRLISTDQALTVKLLKLANSSYYGFPRQISTVNLAIVVLGFETVKHLALSLSVIDHFDETEEKELFNIAKFWEHSIGCGVASGMLAREFRHRVSAEVFIAGLLHDIGKVILSQYFKEEMVEIIEMIEAEGCSFIEAERHIMHITHPEIGKWLAERWNLPPQLVEAIAFHHQPGEAKRMPEIAAMVHLGNIMCHRAGVGQRWNDTLPEPDEQAIMILKSRSPAFHADNLDRYQSKFEQELEKSDLFLAMAKRAKAGATGE